MNNLYDIVSLHEYVNYIKDSDGKEIEYSCAKKDYISYKEMLSVLSKTVGFKFSNDYISVFTYKEMKKWGINITLQNDINRIDYSYVNTNKLIKNRNFRKDYAFFDNVFDALEIAWKIFNEPDKFEFPND